MSFLQTSTWFIAITSVLVACGGTSGNPLEDGGGDGSSDGAANGDSNGDSSSDAAADANNSDGAACPDEHGSYTIALSGQGCGNTSTNVKECIQEVGCTITLVSMSSGSSGSGLTGTTPIGGDGSFTDAAITEGVGTGSARTGCVGTWDNNTSTLVVTCGGTNTSQSCVATLTRKSLNCN